MEALVLVLLIPLNFILWELITITRLLKTLCEKNPADDPAETAYSVPGKKE